MVSTLNARTHYDVLGVAPGASAAEIGRAFAREIGRPRPFGGMAELSIAYETLRDPERRRVYDRSLRREVEPEPRSLWQASSYAVRAAAQMVPAEPVTRPEPAPEARPFIAARLEELASPEPLRRPLPPRSPEPVAEPVTHTETPSPLHPAERVVVEAPSDVSPARWKPIALAGGGALLAVGLIGGWAGWRSSSSGAEPRTAERSALLTPPTTFSVDDPAATATLGSTADVIQPPAAARTHVRAKPAAKRPIRTGPRLAELDTQLAEPTTPATSDAAADPPAPAAVAARLPLPNAVIARTIGRIGYPCGAVASATPAAAGGAFTVTCTSGHSYRAAPVRGRYHFRRVAGG